jgi:hypothetical protein
MDDGADNCAMVYGTSIECTDRDAAFVLDGLPYHGPENLPEQNLREVYCSLSLSDI